ncbi:hypothetical protein GMORB2_0954 [Geosmithia morbida]|uniref:Uncharacterized protein n=1 Tax=Geosmithia morbida TaxID=1094350 RepID=A0A9P4Z105_9HYPO|nr:uncharacterized protein GMORB2_0954 [Geosmithia morbida]KAF4125710.1 hypothetical protein GMORB2_0954 [Geosmithia morbida]
MKSAVVAITCLAAMAAAVPGAPEKCQPATYSCTVNPETHAPGWQVCNTSGDWVFAGDCPPHTVCKFLEANGSPYCVPPKYSIS